MAVDPAAWLTLFEVLEQTTMPYPDILRLADEGLLTTRKSGQVVLYRADDVSRLAATGHALVVTPADVESAAGPSWRRTTPGIGEVRSNNDQWSRNAQRDRVDGPHP